ncbi:MAG: hypothetical protein IAE80_22935 [Anaerolinea sp.]|nr:hypothetical protein [Anaerolinea sp.]
MRDLDVIERVSRLFQTKYTIIPPRQVNWSVTYKAVIRCTPSAELMRLLYPLMGKRRQLQIDQALENYVEKSPEMRHVSHNKLNETQVREIKQRIALNQTSKEIAADYGITIFTIREIRQGKIWKHVTLENSDPVVTPSKSRLKPDFKSRDWLAGILEAEGSFCPAPPSAPNSPYISLAMTDEDIVARVGDIFDVKHQLIRRRDTHHKDYYLLRLKGMRAVEFMRLLYPKMGQRRQAQIARVIDTYQPHDASNHRPGAKLTADNVRRIRERLAAGESLSNIAAEFDVSYSSIVDIRLRRTWKNI